MKERSLLDYILDPGTLKPLFQPIYEFSGRSSRPHSVEALIRGPRGTHMEAPDILFEYVRRKGEERLVDRACVKAVLAEAGSLPANLSLSMNVHASTLGKDREFAAFLCEEAASNSFDTNRLIVEIVEYAPFWDGPKFLASLEELRTSGVKIALDDMGVGQSNYRMLLDCHPDYFKVDRYIVQGSHNDPSRQAVLESILMLACRFNARAIAEGVERREELDALLELGVNLVQGYLLSLPLEISQLAESLFTGDGSEIESAQIQEGVV